MLRAARWWDIEAMAAMDAELFVSDAWSAELFWSELAGVPQSRWYRVAMDTSAAGEHILGYVGLAVSEGTADVQTIAVSAAAQGRGLGGVLLDALIIEAGARGCSEILLEVRADNAAARALYARREFAEIAVRRRYYADGCDALILRRKLEN
ncbi:MAG: ribosomal protein S18-alanine N-acetyltransferase [Sporichthyaceae bacterium]